MWIKYVPSSQYIHIFLDLSEASDTLDHKILTNFSYFIRARDHALKTGKMQHVNIYYAQNKSSAPSSTIYASYTHEHVGKLWMAHHKFDEQISFDDYHILQSPLTCVHFKILIILNKKFTLNN